MTEKTLLLRHLVNITWAVKVWQANDISRIPITTPWPAPRLSCDLQIDDIEGTRLPGNCVLIWYGRARKKRGKCEWRQRYGHRRLGAHGSWPLLGDTLSANVFWFALKTQWRLNFLTGSFTWISPFRLSPDSSGVVGVFVYLLHHRKIESVNSSLNH